MVEPTPRLGSVPPSSLRSDPPPTLTPSTLFSLSSPTSEHLLPLTESQNVSSVSLPPRPVSRSAPFNPNTLVDPNFTSDLSIRPSFVCPSAPAEGTAVVSLPSPYFLVETATDSVLRSVMEPVMVLWIVPFRLCTVPRVRLLGVDGSVRLDRRGWSMFLRSLLKLGAPTISQLFFADDTLLFGRASASDIDYVKQTLDTYARALGQVINLDKWEIVFSGGIPLHWVEVLAERLGVRRVDEHAVYLGIPTNFGRSRCAIFRSLVDRVTKKVKDWKSKILSQAGKLTIVKSVVQAIPTYLMPCFIIPKTIIEQIEFVIARFLWGQKKDERRVHWLKWDVLCRDTEDGGLGLRRLGDFNLALLAKQGWRLMTDESSLLAQTLKAWYYPSTSFLNARVGYNPSFTWHSILDGRVVLQQGLAWRVGSGSQIRIRENP
ncbi:hypothetical protein ACS0TY_008385 [Phlomoides rotata]